MRWKTGALIVPILLLGTHVALSAAETEPIWQVGEIGEVNDLVIQGRTVNTVGCSEINLVNVFTLQSFDRLSGELLWVHTDSAQPSCGLAVAVRGNQLYVGRDVASGVQCFDLGTGDLLWEDGLNWRVHDIAVAANRVHAWGNSRGDALLRTYDYASGRLLWEASGEQGPFSPSNVTAGPGNAIYTGWGQSLAFPYWVRAHDGRTGRLLWENEAGDPMLLNLVWAVASEGSRLYTGGLMWDATCPGSFSPLNRFMVRTYDGRTGALLWATCLEGFGVAVNGLTAKGGRVFATGSSTFPPPGGPAQILAYDGLTGNILWEDKLDTGYWSARAVVADSEGVYFVGSSETDSALRAYEGSRGTVLWEDSFQGTSAAIAVQGSHVYVGGSAGLRAYDARE